MYKTLITLVLMGSFLLAAGCGGDGGIVYIPVTGGVSIQNKGAYYEVVMDYTGRTHRQMGRSLATEIQRVVPVYEATMDSILKKQLALLYEFTQVDFFPIAVARAHAIFKNVPQEYQEELYGMQEVFDYRSDVPGDGRLSANELLVMELFPDVLRPTACSASAAFGSSSVTGKTVLGRNLDWFTAPLRDAANIQAVTTMKNGEKTTCNISVLGFLSAGSQFNSHKVFGALLDAEIPEMLYPADVSKKRSYAFDLRYALENFTTLEQVAEFMGKNDYAFNHLIFLADENKAAVLENNIGWVGRGLRTSGSTLREGLSWGIADTVATVNDFRLPNNYYNPGDKSNSQRWKSFQDLYAASQLSGKIDVERMKGIAGYYGTGGDDEQGALFLSNLKDYKYSTMQSIILRMDTMEMWIHFSPTGGVMPLKPTYIRVSHPLEGS